MKKIDFNKIKKFVFFIRRLLTIALFISTCFYTSFKVAKWNSESIVSVFSEICKVVDIFRLYFFIPLLLFIEIASILNKTIKKEKYYINNILLFIALFFVCASIKVFTYYDRFIYYAIIIYFSRYISFKSLLVSYVVLYSTVLIAIVLGNISGTLTPYVGLRGYSFGFIHYNSAALFLFMYYLAISYLIKNNKKLITFLGFVIELILIFLIKSRTPIIVIVLFVVLIWCEGIYNSFTFNIKKIINYSFVLMPFIMIVFSFGLGKLIYDGIIQIDGNASCRFVEFITFTQERGISLSYCEMGELCHIYYLDNGYAHLLFHYGFVAYAIVTSGQIIANIATVKNKDYHLGIMLVCLYIYNLMEFILYFNDLPLLVIAFASRLFIDKTENISN